MMRMENDNENFDQLKKLLALKKHELPPPGYFNKLPGEIVSRIRTERSVHADPMAKLNAEAPWLMRFWQTLEAKPVFAGAFGAAICSLVLAGIFFAEKPPGNPTLARPNNEDLAPFIAASPVAVVEPSQDHPILMAATNQSGPNLFDLISNGQNTTLPVSARP